MTGGSLGLRTGSYASLQQQLQNGALQNPAISPFAHKPWKPNLSSSRERERVLPLVCRYFGRRRVAMLLLFVLALLVFVFGSFAVSRGLFFFYLITDLGWYCSIIGGYCSERIG